MALLSRGLVRISHSSIPVSILAPLGVIVVATLVLTVARILASLAWTSGSRARVGGALGRVRVGIELEGVTIIIVGLEIVARQARNWNLADWRGCAVPFLGIIWLPTDV
jgi:hypothetical protein